ncbi:MAG TPA: hypothetical protein VLF93_04875 [Candidatus Saccharimonadales bacterium]|nr:hypothetical protein [Candidatus Saccharimonadales bacterium]
MNLLAKLEKTKILWWIIILCTLFFFLRFPSIIEPYWYGDEGIYEVVGQSMDHGHLLYRDIWDNKPPLLYVVYALAGGDQPTVKIYSILAGILSIIAFFILSEKVLNKPRVSIIITVLYVLLLGTPLLESNIANAEDFILLPIILGGLLVYHLVNKHADDPKHLIKSSSKIILFWTGILLGIAFLFKIVAIFDMATFVCFFILINLPKKMSWTIVKNALIREINVTNKKSWFRYFLLGFVAPFILTVIYFAANHAFTIFFQSTFSGNVSYVGWQNGLLGIPQGLLFIKTVILLAALYAIFMKRALFSKPALFIILWLIFSVYNAYFSERPYTHYVLVLLPSFCLFIGLLFTTHTHQTRLRLFAILASVLLLLIYQFQFNFVKAYLYYPNAVRFLTNEESVQTYQSFFDTNVPRDYAVATFINKSIKPSDNIFIWGNNAQIYALSHKLPPGKYTVAYHILQNNALVETQIAIDKSKPKYIIALKEIQPLPFALPLYIMRYDIPGAIIYERSF